MKFYKYHGLGNDYVVLDPADGWITLTKEQIKTICHRNFGVGSDGILYGPIPCEDGFLVKIYNPDGSEAEKSGNGLRIFSRYLYDKKLVGTDDFAILTAAGKVVSQVIDQGENVKIEMGKVSFDASRIPVKDLVGDVINREIVISGKPYLFSAATIGNPHCVVLTDPVNEFVARQLGPLIENHPFFPNRTNVQFVKVINRTNISIEIWERGAGYTLASGSSSIAAASVCKKLGLCDNDVLVHMPGGELHITLSEEYDVRMTGPVVAVCQGEINSSIFR